MRLLRTAATFLLALHAMGTVELALGGIGSVTLVAVIFAALVSLVGEGPARDRVQRDRAASYRIGSAWSLYALYVGCALLLGGTADDMAVFLVGILMLVELVFLGWPAIGPRAVPLLVNSLALCLVASLAGGLLSVIAVGGFAPLAAFLIVVDHHEQRRARPSEALLAAAPHVAVAIAFVWPAALLLPRRSTGGKPGVAEQLDWSDLADGSLELFFWAAVGLGLIFLARWLLKKLRQEDEGELPQEEQPLAEAGASQRLHDGLPPLELDLSGARGRIVRVFESFLASAAKLGFERRPHWTAREFARKLPSPASELAALFGRARYSEDELRDPDAAKAERAAELSLERLRKV